MSLLDNTTRIILTAPERYAAKLKSLPKQQFDQLLKNWEDGIILLWGQPDMTPLILSELGTNALELFMLSSSTISFLESLTF